MAHSTDSINWPPEFSELKKLDVILKCGICYDFMNNCLITSCSHTYCSLCIRKFMQYKNQCPTCYEETYEINLRNNRILDEVILVYTKIRDKLLRASRLASVNIPPKYESKDGKSDTKDDSKTKESVNKVKSASVETSKEEEMKPLSKVPLGDADTVVVNGIKVPGMFTSPKISSIRPRRPEELTSCPVCEVKVPAKNINIHLDSCLALDPASKPRKKMKRRSPLPKRVYTMMPEKSLKKFLKEYGLNLCGDRKAMINRLQRYTVIYNAENDAVNPRPVSELIKQLEREEREEKKPNAIRKNLHTSGARPVVSKNDIEAIEKANKTYCEENKASFKKLIEEMRAREGRNIKPLKPINRIYSDDEDDPNQVNFSVYEDMPSTSKECNSSPITTGSRITTNHPGKISCSSDSEEDIFLISNTEDKPEYGKIDWNKTFLANEDGTPESIYDMMTQKPMAGNNLSPDKEFVKQNKLSVDDIEEICSDSLSTDYSDSDSSVFFGTSKIKSLKQKSKEKIKKSNKRQLRLSLSWKQPTGNETKKSVSGEWSVNDQEYVKEDVIENNTSTNDVQIDDDLKNNCETEENATNIDINSDPECTEFIGFEDTKKTNKITEEVVVLNETINEEEKASDYNGEAESNIKEEGPFRFTRSAKRKSISKEEMKSDEEVNSSPPVSSKKTKRDLGLSSPEI